MASHIVSFLQVARAARGVSILLEQGFELSQIAGLLEEAREQGLVELVDDELRLTSEGLRVLAKSGPTGGPNEWIRPLEECRIPPILPTAVFLPMFPPE